MSGRVERKSGARKVARKLALQALYRWQLNACEWQDLVSESGFSGSYQTVKRFIRKLGGNQQPQPRSACAGA